MATISDNVNVFKNVVVNGKMLTDHNHNIRYYNKTEYDNMYHLKWTQIASSSNYLLPTSSFSTITVTSGNYYNRILAFEVRAYSSTDSFETHIVFARMGSDSTTTASNTLDRFYSWSNFDGQYYSIKSFKAYCNNSVGTSIFVGHAKKLVGEYNTDTDSINWTIPAAALFVEKIWLVN